jgi:hypothetical protein
VADNKTKQEDNSRDVYFTQKELAKRWRVTESTIKSIRDNGGISYFFPPNSSRVLYPRNEVVRIERELLVSNKKEVRKRKEQSVNKREKPVISENSSREWRI